MYFIARKEENHLKYEYEVYKSALVCDMTRFSEGCSFSMTMDLKQLTDLLKSTGSVFSMVTIY
jgi:hypothetical protein